MKARIDNLEQDLRMQIILLEETERDRDYFEKMWKEITNFVETEATASSSDKGPDFRESLPMITYLWPIVPWTPQPRTNPTSDGVTGSEKKRKKADDDFDNARMTKKVKHILELCDQNTITVEYYDVDNDIIILE